MILAVSNILFLILLGLFIFLLSGVITLIYYYIRYVRDSKEEKRIVYEELNEKATHGSIVFLGDSLTDFYRTNEFFLNVDIYNRGIAGDTTDDVLRRLDQNVLNIKPRKIFLQIGTNDLGFKVKPDKVIEKIKLIVDRILESLPDVDLYLISLYPINPSAIAFSKTVTRPRKNTQINYINAILEQWAEEKFITYVDVATHLKDEKGNLRKEYTIEGLHLSLLGYAKITEILKPYVF